MISPALDSPGALNRSCFSTVAGLMSAWKRILASSASKVRSRPPKSCLPGPQAIRYHALSALTKRQRWWVRGSGARPSGLKRGHVYAVLFFLTTGMCCGFLLRRRSRLIRAADRLMAWCVYGLLFFLGVSVGVNETVVSQLGVFGVQGLVLAVGGIVGSVAAVYVLEVWLFRGVGCEE